jgi:hypothetical protein
MAKKRPKPVSISDPVARDFGTLGNAVLDLVTTIRREHWPPDSPAGLECADDPTYADRYPTVDPKPVTDAQLVAVSSLIGIGDNLRGIADCLGGRANLFSAISLARVATGAAASTYWRLEPAIGSGERARRHVAIQLGGIADRSRMVGRERNPDAYRSEDQDRQSFLAWGTKHGFPPAKAGRAYDNVQQWTVGDEVPNEMTLIRGLLESLGLEISDVIYRITSAFVHSTSNSLLMVTSRVAGVSEHGVAQGAVGMSVGRLILLTASAVYGTHLTVVRLLEHFGMDVGAWQTMAQPILVRWGDAARAELAMRPMVIG